MRQSKVPHGVWLPLLQEAINPTMFLTYACVPDGLWLMGIDIKSLAYQLDKDTFYQNI